MSRPAPVITTFMAKRWENCPECHRPMAVRSDGKFERHNKVKGERGICVMSHQPSGRPDIRKPDKKDRVALMKTLVKERKKRR